MLLTTLPDLAERHCRPDRPGGAVRDGGRRRRRRRVAGVEERPADAARAARPQPRPRRRRVPRLRRARHRAPCRAVRPPLVRRPTPPPPRRSPTASSRITASVPGDRVTIAMRNFPEWSIAFWGATAAGAVVVPLNAWWTGPELAYGLADSGSQGADRRPRAGRAHRRAPRPSSRTCEARHRRPRRHGEPAPGHDRVRGRHRRRGRRPRSSPTSPSGPRTTRRSSTRPARPASRRARSGTHRNICTNLLSLGYCAAPDGDASANGTRRPPSGAREPQRVPALRAVLPRHRLPFGPRRRPCRRRGDRDHAPLGRRAGAAADRAGAGHRLRRRAGDGVAGARAPRLRPLRPVLGAGRSATAARRRRPSWSAGSRPCSPAGRRPTATG